MLGWIEEMRKSGESRQKRHFNNALSSLRYCTRGEEKFGRVLYLKLVSGTFQQRRRYQVLPVLYPALDPDWVTIPDAFFKLANRISCIAVSANNLVSFTAVSLLMRKTARTGIQKGKSCVRQLDNKKIDVFPLKAVSIEFRHIEFKARCFNYDISTGPL